MALVGSIRRFEVHLVDLDPTRGAEMQKSRPCVVVSPDEMNRHIRTVIIAPLTSVRRDYPTRVDVVFQRKKGQVAVDHIRAVDRSRLVARIGRLTENSARAVADVLQEMFAYD